MRRCQSNSDVKYTGVTRGFFFQAEDGIRAAEESRGLGDVYKRQGSARARCWEKGKKGRQNRERNGSKAESLCGDGIPFRPTPTCFASNPHARPNVCLFYTSDAADDLRRVDLGGPRHIKKKTTSRPSHYFTLSLRPPVV